MRHQLRNAAATCSFRGCKAWRIQCETDLRLCASTSHRTFMGRRHAKDQTPASAAWHGTHFPFSLNPAQAERKGNRSAHRDTRIWVRFCGAEHCSTGTLVHSVCTGPKGNVLAKSVTLGSKETTVLAEVDSVCDPQHWSSSITSSVSTP